MNKKSKIIDIEIDDQHIARFAPHIQREYHVAKQDVIMDNEIYPLLSPPQQEYILKIKLINNFNLKLQFCETQKEKICMDIHLKLLPFKSIIKDYFILCESFYHATQNSPVKVEAFDMGRRAIHNEGADLLLTQFEKEIKMDHGTARKLFTLICALHLNLRNTA